MHLRIHNQQGFFSSNNQHHPDLQESLWAWWQKHDKKASWKSSELTKELAHLIETKNCNNPKDLKEILIKADKWLANKHTHNSSRFQQVLCLRNNIFNRLITEFGEDKHKLAKLNWETLQKEYYLFKYWAHKTRGGFMIPKELHELDRAFIAHLNDPQISLEKDKLLLEALSNWLGKKEHSKSKHYALVQSIHQRLEKIVDNCYPANAQQPEEKPLLGLAS